MIRTITIIALCTTFFAFFTTNAHCRQTLWTVGLHGGAALGDEPDMPAAMDRTAKILTRDTELRFDFTLLSLGQEYTGIIELMAAEETPDIITVETHLIPILAADGRIIPLDAIIPNHVRASSAELLDQCSLEGRLYGLPLAARGDLSRYALAIGSYCAERGMANQASLYLLTLLEQLDEQNRAMPDNVTPLDDRERLEEGTAVLVATHDHGCTQAEIAADILADEEFFRREQNGGLNPGTSAARVVSKETTGEGYRVLTAAADHEGLLFQPNTSGNRTTAPDRALHRAETIPN